MRRLDGCINCQEVREIAAHGLCFKCYRAEERAQKATPDPVWARLGNGYLLREQKKALTVVTGILKAIVDCPAVEENDRKQIQNILRPYLDKLAECFAPKEKRKPVNSEQKFERSPVNGRLVRLEEGELSKVVASNKTAGNGLSNQIESGEEQ
jgi:hypothetical protein